MFREEIDRFLSEKCVAVAGVSRDDRKFSNTVYRKLKESGRQVYPVHPRMEALDGDACLPGVSSLPGEVRALMVVASPTVCAKVLADVAGTGITRVWVFTGKRSQPDADAQIRRLRESGVDVVSGLCPFMFIEPVSSVHAVHRFFVRLVGKYPR